MEWSVGKSNRIPHSTQAEVTHVYEAASEYEVRMYGLIEGISYSNTAQYKNRDNIIDISQCGHIKLGTDGKQFGRCRFLNVSAIDACCT